MNLNKLPTPDPESALWAALREFINHKINTHQLDSISNGFALQEPHFELADFVAKLQHFRTQQLGLEKVFAEACAEDDSLSDDWLLISDAGKAMDCVLQELFTITYHYTKVISDLTNNKKLLDIVTSKSDEIVEQRCCEDPELRQLLDYLQNPR